MQEILKQLVERFEKWDTKVEDIGFVLNYLRQYGYLPDKNNHSGHILQNLDIHSVIAGISKFQEIAGLYIDGEIGPKTLKAMYWPRCGMPDDTGIAKMEVEASSWGKKNLTYFIENRDNTVTAQEWDAAMELAFQQWCHVADLKITRVTNKSAANFIMSTGAGRQFGFDGPGGTLAWAQLPPRHGYTGQLLSRFDTAENWIVDPTRNGIMLVNVACHEIGHLLGLGHSNVNGELMAPFYNRSISKPIQNNDIPRIQNLYGKPTVVPTPPPVNPPVDPVDPNPGPTPLPEGTKEFTITVFGKEITHIDIPGFRVNKIG
jgi:hypothetical protein